MANHISGNATDLDKNDIALLQGIDESIVNAYEAKTGLNRQELADLMSKDTWMNAQLAIEKGFADEIMFSDETVTVVNSTGAPFDKNAVNKLKNLLIKAEKPQEETLLQKN